MDLVWLWKEERIAKEKQVREERESLIIRRKAEKKQREKTNKEKKEALEKEIHEKGLSFLSPEIDFAEAKPQIENYYKINDNSLNESDISKLKSFVLDNTKSKPKEWKKFNKGNWKLIIKWVGKETASIWHNETTK